MNIKSILKEILLFLVIVFGVVLPFRTLVAEPYLVDGRSMDPTFHTNDYLIVDKLSYRFSNPERGSVIVFNFPKDPTRKFIKRIIGLPNETVSIRDGIVTISNIEHPNGITLNQDYISRTKIESMGPYTLGPDEYFVMGDNRSDSWDSREWGAVKSTYLLGRPIIRLFPFKDIEFSPGDHRNDIYEKGN